MNQVSEHIEQANKAGIETLATVANAAFGAVERIAALNLSTVRRLLEQQESGSRQFMAARDAQTLLSLQAKAMLDDTKQVMNYSQRAFEITSQTRDEISRVLEKGLSVPSKTKAA
jgi:phasin family protein